MINPLLGKAHSVFLYSLNLPTTTSSLSGPVPDAAEVIEGVEAIGWRLADMTYADKMATKGTLLLLFRRPMPPLYPPRRVQPQLR